WIVVVGFRFLNRCGFRTVEHGDRFARVAARVHPRPTGGGSVDKIFGLLWTDADEPHVHLILAHPHRDGTLLTLTRAPLVQAFRSIRAKEVGAGLAREVTATFLEPIPVLEHSWALAVAGFVDVLLPAGEGEPVRPRVLLPIVWFV